MRKQQNQNQVSPVTIMAGAVVVLLLVSIINSVHIVQPGEVGVVIRLGTAQELALGEGIHFVIPYITQVRKLDVRIQRTEARTDAATQDLQMVQAAIVINYRIDQNEAVNLFRRIGVDYLRKVIEPAIQEAFKAGCAKYTAEELITQRATVSQEIQESISSRLIDDGVVISAVNITHFEFSAEFNAAIEAKVRESQRVEQAERELERFKIEAQQAVEKAKGAAEAILEKAKAEAEALGLKKEFATLELVLLTAVEKWDGVLPTHLFGTPPVPVFETGQ